MLHSSAERDFTPLVDMLVVFEPGSGSLLECENISINNDTILEDDEQFTVALTTLDSDVTVRPNTATVTIIDDDGIGFFRCRVHTVFH